MPWWRSRSALEPATVIVRCLLNIWGHYVPAHGLRRRACGHLASNARRSRLAATNCAHRHVLSAIATNGEGGVGPTTISRSSGRKRWSYWTRLPWPMLSASPCTSLALPRPLSTCTRYGAARRERDVTEPAYMVNKAWDIRIIASVRARAYNGCVWVPTGWSR